MNYSSADGADKTQRIADGDREFTGTECRGIAMPCGREAGDINLQCRQVAPTVMLQNARRQTPAVPEFD
jgi:hypothetical protein